MKPIYIRGNKKKGDLVIAELVVKHGGFNGNGLSGDDPTLLYYLDKEGWIQSVAEDYLLYDMLIEHGDELYVEPDFKFKVGDIVTSRFSSYIEGGEITELVNRRGEPWYRLKYIGLIQESDLEPFHQVLDWDDLKKIEGNVNGYYADGNHIVEIEEIPMSSIHRTIYSTKKQAKSAEAMSKISYLINQKAYGGWVELGQPAYGMFLSTKTDSNLNVSISKSSVSGGILRFHTREQAELFIKHNRELVYDYLMLDNGQA